MATESGRARGGYRLRTEIDEEGLALWNGHRRNRHLLELTNRFLEVGVPGVFCQRHVVDTSLVVHVLALQI